MNNQHPHIIFLVLDTHRANRLGCYGYDRATSPNIDTFASAATVYQNAISPAQWTIPSHASMFTGEFPSTHMVVQASNALPEPFTTAAEYLREVGYTSTGFCNNPLVGVLDNGLRRGFQDFYNYGGAIPSPYISETQGVFERIKIRTRNLLTRIAEPIQQSAADSPDVFRFFMNPKLVSLWTRYANFKGDTRQSLLDAVNFIQSHVHPEGRQSPQMVFINLMETHLPYRPPERFIRKYAPIVHENPDARDFINTYNTKAFHWLLPLDKPLPKLERETLNQMYDAEIAYQDHLLRELFQTLDQPYHRENTLVILVGDHGEMLGEHQIMGHGLGSYHELIHVPLIIRYPGQRETKQIPGTVSTAWLFHTILNEVGLEQVDLSYAPAVDLKAYNLKHMMLDGYLGPVLSESYAPDNLLMSMERLTPDLVERFNSRACHRSYIDDPYKLLQVDGADNQLYHLENDPNEMDDLALTDPVYAEVEQAQIAYLQDLIDRRPPDLKGAVVSLSGDQVAQRLRGLGYLD